MLEEKALYYYGINYGKVTAIDHSNNLKSNIFLIIHLTPQAP